MNKFKSSWELFKASIIVTLQHRKLLWFPFITGIATLFIALFFMSAFILPLVLHHTGYHLDQKEHWTALAHYYFPESMTNTVSQTATGQLQSTTQAVTMHESTHAPYVHELIATFLAVLYLPSIFLATFFNVAFYSEIMAALDGRGVSIRRGLQTARQRLSAILYWSLLAGAVGWAIRALEQRVPFAARIALSLIGLTWSVAAVFAIPVIVQEPSTRNPVTVLKHSARTLKQSWGEGLIGYTGFSLAQLLIFFCIMIPAVVGAILAAFTHQVWLGVAGFVLFIVALIIASYVTSVARNVFRCTLFKYATEGTIPEPFTADLLDRAWKIKQ